MHIILEKIRRAAGLQLPPEFISVGGLTPAKDEKDIRDILIDSKWGKEWATTSDWNKFEKWDIEGYDNDGTKTRFEVKSRPISKSQYDTWIIDMYKVDFMVANFPYDGNYFVNSCGGQYHVYDMRYIQECYSKKNVLSWMENGTREPRNFYYVPKKNFMIELSSGELGDGNEFNELFSEWK